jgi:chromosome partitioning protein
MADKRASFTLRVINEIRQYLKDRVFKTIIPRDPKLAEVPIRQAPIIAYERNTVGAKAYIQLSREILNRQS